MGQIITIKKLSKNKINLEQKNPLKVIVRKVFEK